MTEIPIERKPRSKAGALVFLLILLVVAAGVWYWWSTRPTVTTTPATGSIHFGAPAMLARAVSMTSYAERL